jgi:glycosyltransferase involved in cell wall biosynthesis
MRKKICILTTVHPAFDSRVFQKEAKTLANAGYAVTLIAQHNKNEIVDGVKIIALSTPRNRFQRMFGITIRVLYLGFRESASIYHFHDPELIPAGIIFKIFGKKVIYDVHEDYRKQIPSKPYLPLATRKTIAFLIAMLERITTPFFDAVVAATNQIALNFSFHKQIIAICNFPILSNYSSCPRVIFQGRSQFRLIYSGILNEIRGIKKIVEALQCASKDIEIELIICGLFSSQKFEQEIKRLPGFQTVRYEGMVDFNIVPQLMASADAGIVCFLPEPNHIDAMPNKLFEYMAAGLPVIASNFPLWREIVENNKCGICVDPSEPRDIARAIVSLAKDSAICETMGENGRKAVLEKYNWGCESIKLRDLYQKLLSA